MAGSIVQQFRVAARATVEETRQALIATAKRENQRVVQTDPRPSMVIRSVDGVVGGNEEQVRADGTIIYRYPRLGEVVRAAMDILFDLSPVLSGEYRRGHTLFVDGAQVSNLKDWGGTGSILITNVLPYSRKIELGVMTMRVPGTDRVYEQATSMLNKRFGNVARILFTWQGVIGGGAVRGTAGNRSENRYPALRIEAR